VALVVNQQAEQTLVVLELLVKVMLVVLELEALNMAVVVVAVLAQ
jgi:hypothetical protein